MREFGIEPVVYTPENPHYPLRDDTLLSQVPKETRVLRKKIWEPYQLAGRLSPSKTRRISSGIINREDPGWLERLMLWIRGNLFIPDARKYWVAPSVRYLREILAQEGIDTVITTGPPHSLHLIGLQLKKLTGVRWIADFRDPWTSIGYHDALYLSKWARKKHRALEARVLKGADAVITTSSLTRDEFAPLTGKPLHVITNGYSGARNGKGQPEGPFRLSHIGSLLSGRNPVSLWAALGNLVETDPEFRKDLEVHLIGPVSGEVIKSIGKHGLQGHLRLRDYVPHEEALREQRSAQVLLLIEIDRPETRGIIPGKFFEYLAAARPILALGPAGWEVADLVRKTRSGAAFGYGEQEAIEATLRSWYREYRRGTLEVAAEEVREFHRRALAERLVKEVLWA
jgi:glycosyltransferase involved in cell wall biosynthesis